MAPVSQSAVFQNVPALTQDLLAPHVAGGHAALFRHAVAAEKVLASLGTYDPTVDTVYDWPNRPADSIIDLGYVKLFADNAKLRYFQDLVSSASTVQAAAGYRNRVRSSSVAFKANGDAYPRDGLLFDRDVRVGDLAFVRGTVASTSYQLWTTVQGFAGEPVAATVGAASADDANEAALSLAASVDKIAGADNCIEWSLDATAYDGLADGDPEETYTVEVTQGSVGGDYTTALLRVTSASGNDNQSSLVPDALDVWFAVGSRGLLARLSLAPGSSCSTNALDDAVSPTDLVQGQKWKFHVKQNFTPPTATSGGTYTGDSDTTYVVEVTLGGLYANEPEITVSTTTGVDSSGPTAVTAAGVAVAIGTQGVTIRFNQAGLCKGDRYRIAVTAAAEGSMQTLILGNNLPSALLDASDLDLKLYIQKDVQVTAHRIESPPDLNWSAAADAFTVSAAVTAYDSSWTDDGTQLPLPVEAADLYVEYRAWLPGFADKVYSLTGASQVEALLGPVHPDNPLAFGVYQALHNGNSRAVHFTAVVDPDTAADWDTVLDLVAGRDDVYNLVPLTFDETVLAAYAAHVAAQVASDLGLWRSCFLCLEGRDQKVLADESTTSDGQVALATLTDDPSSSGTQYTFLTATSGNVDFVALGVRAGDTVRYLFTSDGFGGTSYSTFTVASVASAESLVLAEANPAAVGVAQKFELWRTQTPAEQAADLAARNAFDSERVVLVWPDGYTDSSVSAEPAGYFLAASLAGLRGSAPPHQPLTNVEVKGPTDLPKSQDAWGFSVLNTLEDAGFLVVTLGTGTTAYTRRGVTSTHSQELNLREESVRANVDSVLLLERNRLAEFRGSANLTDDLLGHMRHAANGVIDELKSLTKVALLDSQLLDGSQVTDCRRHELLNDHSVLTLQLVVGYPDNVIEMSAAV